MTKVGLFGRPPGTRVRLMLNSRIFLAFYEHCIYPRFLNQICTFVEKIFSSDVKGQR